VRSRTVLGTASSAKYQPDIQWFAVRLNQHHEHTSACPGGFLGEKHERQRAGGSITMQTAINPQAYMLYAVPILLGRGARSRR